MHDRPHHRSSLANLPLESKSIELFIWGWVLLLFFSNVSVPSVQFSGFSLHTRVYAHCKFCSSPFFVYCIRPVEPRSLLVASWAKQHECICWWHLSRSNTHAIARLGCITFIVTSWTRKNQKGSAAGNCTLSQWWSAVGMQAAARENKYVSARV